MLLLFSHCHVRLCDPMACSTPGLPVPISQSLSKFLSTELVMPSNHLILCHPLLLLPSIFPSISTLVACCIWLFVTPWTVAHQALLSMEFSRQEYWSGLPFPSPGDFSDTGSFPLSQFFTSSGQNIGASASASILPMSIWGWFPWWSIKSHHSIKNVTVGPELCAPYQRHTNDQGLSALGLPGAHVFTGAEEAWHNSHTVRGGTGCSHRTLGGQSWADRRDEAFVLSLSN